VLLPEVFVSVTGQTVVYSVVTSVTVVWTGTVVLLEVTGLTGDDLLGDEEAVTGQTVVEMGIVLVTTVVE
jgi:hypothetical protein